MRVPERVCLFQNFSVLLAMANPRALTGIASARAAGAASASSPKTIYILGGNENI